MQRSWSAKCEGRRLFPAERISGVRGGEHGGFQWRVHVVDRAEDAVGDGLVLKWDGSRDGFVRVRMRAACAGVSE